MNEHKKLPWHFHKKGNLYPAQIQNREHEIIKITDEFAEYIVNACNAFPELIEVAKETHRLLKLMTLDYPSMRTDTKKINNLLKKLGEL